MRKGKYLQFSSDDSSSSESEDYPPPDDPLYTKELQRLKYKLLREYSLRPRPHSRPYPLPQHLQPNYDLTNLLSQEEVAEQEVAMSPMSYNNRGRKVVFDIAEDERLAREERKVDEEGVKEELRHELAQGMKKGKHALQIRRNLKYKMNSNFIDGILKEQNDNPHKSPVFQSTRDYCQADSFEELRLQQ